METKPVDMKKILGNLLGEKEIHFENRKGLVILNLQALVISLLAIDKSLYCI
jgi:hypothetical protein